MDTTQVRVETCPVTGRILHANGPFEVGQSVLREEPLIEWCKGDDFAYLSAYTAASEATQAKLLDMCHYSILKGTAFDGKAHQLERSVEKATKAFPMLGAELIRKLFRIRDLNAHPLAGQGKSALFYIASKISHSCSPNTMFTSRRKPSHIHFVAIRPVSPGEELTISYEIANLWWAPTRQRQALMLRERSFICGCKRCQGPDLCRVLLCPACSAPVLSQPGKGAALIWTCDVCGILEASTLQASLDAETMFEKQSQQALLKARTQPPNQATVEKFQALLREVESVLSPVHYLVVQIHDCLADIFDAYADLSDRAGADMAKQLYEHSAQDLRLQAMTARVRGNRVCECLAARCTLGGSCNLEHPAVFERSHSALFAAHTLQKLLRTAAPNVPPEATSAANKYLPFLRIVHDDNVTMIRSLESDLCKGKTASPVKGVVATGLSGNVCAHCGKVGGEFSLCAQCKQVRYCSRDCQKKGWKAHRRVCCGGSSPAPAASLRARQIETHVSSPSSQAEASPLVKLKQSEIEVFAESPSSATHASSSQWFSLKNKLLCCFLRLLTLLLLCVQKLLCCSRRRHAA